MRLAENPGISQVNLARHIHVQPPTLARTLARLQETGLVSREVDANDHRVNRLTLTAKGEEVIGELKKVFRAERREIFSVLSVEEQRQLRALIDRISDRYESKMESPGQ